MISLANVNPNQLTTLRLMLTPFAFGLLIYGSGWSLFFCLLLAIVIESTDFLDGYVARKYSKTSDWGKVYDPMCDAIYHLLMYVGLMYFFSSKLFVIAVAIILFRELFVAYLRVFCATKGLVLGAMTIGKFKANTQMASVFASIIWLLSLQCLGVGLITSFWFGISIVLISLAVIATAISFFYYCSFVKTAF